MSRKASLPANSPGSLRCPKIRSPRISTCSRMQSSCVRERRSREIIYRANLERFREVALFLLKDCCGGRPEVCGALIADLAPPRSKKIRV